MSEGKREHARTNRLHGAFEAPSRKRIDSHLEPVKLKLGAIVCEAGGLLKHAYFPQGAVLKIDLLFISDLEDNGQSLTIVRAVIGLARGLGLPVAAEGVETEGQLALLAQEGCDEVQGYLLGRPYPIEEYAELVGRPTMAEHKIILAR